MVVKEARELFHLCGDHLLALLHRHVLLTGLSTSQLRKPNLLQLELALNEHPIGREGVIMDLGNIGAFHEKLVGRYLRNGDSC